MGELETRLSQRKGNPLKKMPPTKLETPWKEDLKNNLPPSKKYEKF